MLLGGNPALSLSKTLAVLLMSMTSLAAESIVHLKNGYEIRVDQADLNRGEWTLKIDGGVIVLPESYVDSVTDRIQSSEEGRVLVTARLGTVDGPVSTIMGSLLTPRDADPIEVALDRGGTVRIAQSRVVGFSSAPPAYNPDEARTVQTRDRVVLKNGETLVGNLIQSEFPDPYQFEIPTLGTYTIDRSQVSRVEAFKSSVEISATRETSPTETIETAPEPPEPALPQILLEDRIRDSLALIESIWRTQLPPPDLLKEIDFNVRELERQRNQNRVRAENKLRAIGPIALPRLAPASLSGFNLTRRAVIRLVGDYGALAGAPYAIRALGDIDPLVREVALTSLEKILGKRRRLSSEPSESEIRRVQEAYWELWIEAASYDETSGPAKARR